MEAGLIGECASVFALAKMETGEQIAVIFPSNGTRQFESREEKEALRDAMRQKRQNGRDTQAVIEELSSLSLRVHAVFHCNLASVARWLSGLCQPLPRWLVEMVLEGLETPMGAPDRLPH